MDRLDWNGAVIRYLPEDDSYYLAVGMPGGTEALATWLNTDDRATVQANEGFHGRNTAVKITVQSHGLSFALSGLREPLPAFDALKLFFERLVYVGLQGLKRESDVQSAGDAQAEAYTAELRAADISNAAREWERG